MSLHMNWHFLGFLMLLIPGAACLGIFLIVNLPACRNNRYLRWELIGKFMAAVAVAYVWYQVAFTLLLKR